jgi:hypothetical protein
VRLRILVGWLAVAACAPADIAKQIFAEVMQVDTVIASSGDGYDLYNADFARTLSDGRLAVLNAGSQEVLIFSAGGTLDLRFGGEGRGPGEFRRPAFMGTLPGDSIVVTDWAQRASVFTADGVTARTFDLDGPPDGGLWYAFPNGISSDRALIGSLGFEEPAQGAPGVVRIPISVVVHDLEGTFRILVERSEFFREFFVIESEGTPRVVTPPPVIHARSASGGSGFLIARTTSRDVLFYGSDGLVRDTLRLPEATPMSGSTIDGLRNAWVDEATSEEARTLRRRASDEAPTSEDPYVVGDVAIDLLDRIWIREANLEAEPLASWYVYEGGVLLGYVDLPAELSVREIGADYVLGVQRDELDVETIVRVRFRAR